MAQEQRRMATALGLADVEDAKGVQVLWRFEPPIWNADMSGLTSHGITVSVPTRTALYATDETGKVTNYIAVSGLEDDPRTHADLIAAIGYEATTPVDLLDTVNGSAPQQAD